MLLETASFPLTLRKFVLCPPLFLLYLGPLPIRAPSMEEEVADGEELEEQPAAHPLVRVGEARRETLVPERGPYNT